MSTDGTDDVEGRSSVTHVLGVALQMSGDLEGARDVMAERLALARAAGDDFIVWVESANLSMVERRLGNVDRAVALASDALRMISTGSDEMAIAWTINGLAAATAATGAHQRAGDTPRAGRGDAGAGRRRVATRRASATRRDDGDPRRGARAGRAGRRTLRPVPP